MELRNVTGSEPLAPVEDRYFNRELSWLDFNARVLTLVEDPLTPLLERMKFLAIFANNLDEFFMVRVAGLKRQVAARVINRSPDGLTPSEQLEEIAERLGPIIQRHAELFTQDVLPALGKADVHILRWKELDEAQQDELNSLFQKQIFPVVTPLAVDPAHPFPYISNLSLNLAVLVQDPASRAVRFARVKVPPLLSRFVGLTSGNVFVPLEDVIAANSDRLFPGMHVVEQSVFRVTRNADLEVDDDGAEDLLQALEEELRKRRYSPAVRLEIEEGTSERVLELLQRELQVTRESMHVLPGPIGLSGLWDLYSLERPELKDPPFHPVTPKLLQSTDDTPPDLFEVLQEQDILVQHPYESFATSVQRFVEQAAHDPNVLAIKQTLYRTSGEGSIVDALADAAQAGKQVVVLVEIKARFDEQANIEWARTLERAGCHVVYGLVGLKTHCKLCLVVRQEGANLRRYVHIGTGNYNSRTARLYEDFGLFTANDLMGADVSDLFNQLTGYSRQTDYRRLIVAPHGMRDRVISMIDREATLSTEDKPGRIIMKMNALVDVDVIEALYRASTAGVRIDLLVRGICSLRPGIPGLSENIRVRSILGRFLEHSRVLFFRGEHTGEFYIGSADMMPRNLDRRVEVLIRIDEPELKARLQSILSLLLSKDVDAWELSGDGNWARLEHGDRPLVDVQTEIMQRIAEDA
jgi:polyphosphate kinase